MAMIKKKLWRLRQKQVLASQISGAWGEKLNAVNDLLAYNLSSISEIYLSSMISSHFEPEEYSYEKTEDWSAQT